MNENDTHRELLEYFYKYVKANLIWEKKPSIEKSIDTRRILSDIRRLATKRREEILQAEKQRLGRTDSKLQEADDQDD